MAASTSLSPVERVHRAKLAAHLSWAKTADPAARTAPARSAALARFEREVDPDGKLDPVERARRAQSAKRAHFHAMALRSAKKRSAKPHKVAGEAVIEPEPPVEPEPAVPTRLIRFTK